MNGYIIGETMSDPQPTEPKSTWKGPRNLPKPDSRKKKRQVVKAARKRNRGVYSGQ